MGVIFFIQVVVVGEGGKQQLFTFYLVPPHRPTPHVVSPLMGLPMFKEGVAEGANQQSIQCYKLYSNEQTGRR